MTAFKDYRDRQLAKRMARLLAISSQAAKVAYRDSFDAYYDLLEPLEPDQFWRIIPAFKQEIVSFRFGLKRTNGVESASWEIFRKVLTNKTAHTIEELIRFSKTYYDIEALPSEALYEGRMDKSDDGLGDLMDSLPLAGREVHEKAAKGFYGTIEALEEAVLEAVHGEEKLMKFICHGENYVAMRLKEAAQNAFRSQSMHLLDEKEDAA